MSKTSSPQSIFFGLRMACTHRCPRPTRTHVHRILILDPYLSPVLPPWAGTRTQLSKGWWKRERERNDDSWWLCPYGLSTWHILFRVLVLDLFCITSAKMGLYFPESPSLHSSVSVWPQQTFHVRFGSGPEVAAVFLICLQGRCWAPGNVAAQVHCHSSLDSEGTRQTHN